MKLAIIALVLTFAISANAWYRPAYGHGHRHGYGRGYGYPSYGYRYYDVTVNRYYGKRAETERETEMPRLNRTECVYTVDNRMVSCQGPYDVVECEAELTWTYPVEFEMFGLSRTDEGYYRTFPRRLDNSGWDDNNLMYNGEYVHTRMYYANETCGLGLRVLDQECFNRVDKVLNASLRNEEVYYQKVDKEYETAFLRADLVVAETVRFDEETKETSKRWYPYGYWGRFNRWNRYRPYGGFWRRRYYWKRSGSTAIDTEFMPEF